MGDKALAASGFVAVPDPHLKPRWCGLTTGPVSPKRNGGSTMVRTMSFWTRESVFGCAESRHSRGAYARRQDVLVGTLARREAECESAKVDGTGMRLVEVEMVPMPTEERLRPEAAGELVSSWYRAGTPQRGACTVFQPGGIMLIILSLIRITVTRICGRGGLRLV
jgi:hypothetical protein